MLEALGNTENQHSIVKHRTFTSYKTNINNNTVLFRILVNIFKTLWYTEINEKINKSSRCCVLGQ